MLKHAYLLHCISNILNPNSSAPPGPPNVMAQTIGPDMVQVVVSPSPNGGLPTSYNVTISNSSYTSSSVVMASGSAMVNGLGLRNGTLYNISVVPINSAGLSNSTTIQSYISCKYMYICTCTCIHVWYTCGCLYVHR